MLTEENKIKVLNLLDELEASFNTHPFATILQDIVWVAISDYDLYRSPQYGAWCSEIHQRDDMDGIRITFCHQHLNEKQRNEYIKQDLYLEISK